MPGKGNYSIPNGAPVTVISPPQLRDMFIVNTGSTTVYLAATSADCTSTNGMPLTTGATKQWYAGDELYAICGSPDTGTLNVSDNAGGLTDPTAIGRAIFVAGTPPIDKRTRILHSGLQGFPYTSAQLDTSSYTSVTISSLPSLSIGPVSMTFEVDWYTADSLVIPIARDVFWHAAGGDPTYATIPVKGSIMTISITAAAAGTTDLSVFGSYSAVKQSYWGSGASVATGGSVVGAASEGIQRWTGALPVSTTWAWDLHTISGPVKATFRCASAGPHSADILIRTTQSTLAVVDSALGLVCVVGTQQKFDWYNPAEGMQITIANLSAANILTFRFVVMNLNPWGS